MIFEIKLFITILIELIIAEFLIMLIHELGHKSKFSKYGIKSKINFNPLKHFVSIFSDKKIPFANCNTKEDDKVNKLDLESKKDIFFAGIRVEIFSLLIITIILFIEFISSYFFDFNNLMIIVYVNIFLVLMILCHGLSLFSNIFNKNSDVQRFIELLIVKDKPKKEASQ